ncbi:M1 family metallopeptidase [Paenibacillus thailandensis]|uniref:M1 family metallopeptidase n=1 Tax=Paenibacillus thailandensis TaxID=393250 RepID=A0ABW5R1I7_9BACL
MTPRLIKRIAFITVSAVLLVLSVRQGFGEAWQSQYTYAFSPDASGTAEPAAASEPAKPNAPAEKEPIMQPQPQPVALSKRVSEYHINVNLEEGNLLQGQQSVTWTNPGRRTVSEMYFHLYPNAFLSDKTTFMRESGGRLREDKATADSYGYMKLTSLTTEQGESLLPRLHFVRPDDGNENDYTLAKLRLPEPVAPGASVTLQMNFEVKLPEVFARMGYSGQFVMAGQWFPKIAAYETSGTRGRTSEGWNVHQYHGNSEFYSDFGIYSVRIGVPESYKVAATGFQTKASETKDGRKYYQFYADDVHDFAWAASPDFVYYEESLSTPHIPGVRIKLYMDPAHAKLQDRYMHAAKSSLTKYAQWYGEYPYTTLSVVVPPAGAGGAGGMEYPTLVTALAADKASPGYELERTVVHEIGHQYWYGMVASNEFEEAWLDEGFTSYAEDKVMETVYGLIPNLPLEASYITDPEPLKQVSWSYRSSDQYAENVYLRAKLVLLGIEKIAGERGMQKILRTYFQKYKFKHPSTGDFQRVVEQVTKDSWNPYFSSYVYGRRMADYSVESIKVRPVEQDGKKMYESSVLVRNNGGIGRAVPIVLQFKDGTTMPKIWDGEDTHVQYDVVSESPLAWAVVDPNHTNVLDNKHINNFMLAEVADPARIRWSLGAVKLIESIIRAFSW